MSPALQTLLWEVGGYRIFVYKMLQHGSTLLGFAVLTRWGWHWFGTTCAQPAPCGWQPSAAVRVPALLVLLVAPALGGLLSGLGQMGEGSSMGVVQQGVSHGLITALRLFGTIVLGFGVLWRLWETRRCQRLTAPGR